MTSDGVKQRRLQNRLRYPPSFEAFETFLRTICKIADTLQTIPTQGLDPN